MKKFIVRDADRGKANFGWLKANYTFSFANYYNPQFMQFGALRVMNDDRIAAGGGFPTHPHNDMEIITIPLSGKLEHKDSTGQEGIITAGEVQVMSAGSGIYHSEANPDPNEELNLLQIWVFPKEHGIQPRYDQKRFDLEGNKNQFVNIIHPEGANGALRIHQNAYFHMGVFDEDTALTYKTAAPNHGVFAFVIKGAANFVDTALDYKDAVGVYPHTMDEYNQIQKDGLPLNIQAGSKVLLMEVPLN
jgi:quercetin 2,3-dioxygenase